MKMPHQKLDILITGASRGIGAAIASTLGQDHNVVILGRDIDALTHVASGLPAGNVRVMQCDMQSTDDIHRVCQAIGKVDVLVNNAGIALFGDVVEMSGTDIERQIATNLLGPLSMIKNLLPSMLSRRSGMIISINSVASTTVFRGAAAYSASKAGLLAFTRSLRQEVRDHNVKVVDLIVGATETEIWSSSSRSEHGHRMMTADHIADIVEQLVQRFHDNRSMIEEITIRPQLGDL